MYSVVLATMLTAAGAAPDWHCHGCHGCYCSCSCGCWGCHGCHGCWGCHGCHGCWGWSCYGCWGCYGCYGCSCGGVVICSGCFGCYGCSCVGCCCGGVVVVPQAPPPPAKKEKAEATPSQATIVVQLPADAQLYVDDKRATLTSSTRTFITPDLQTDRAYTYTLRVEAQRDGRTVTATKNVVFRAGEVARIDFGDLKETPVAQTKEAPKPARVTVRAPEDARLTIDGRNCPLTNGTRTFETPKLEVGKKYFYEVEARVARDGRQLVEKRKVTLEAGKKVDVDFTALGSTRAAALR